MGWSLASIGVVVRLNRSNFTALNLPVVVMTNRHSAHSTSRMIAVGQ
jgi:hypothetical protein